MSLVDAVQGGFLGQHSLIHSSRELLDYSQRPTTEICLWNLPIAM
jgi:hypothetical protein